MPANYMAADALTYLREHLGNTLDWVHDTLADAYGLEMIDGEEYLPEPLSQVMSALHDVHRQTTDEAVAVGAYARDGDRLYRPRYYSTGHPIYTVETNSRQVEAHRLQHPSGLHQQPAADPDPVTTRRAGLRVLQGGEPSA